MESKVQAQIVQFNRTFKRYEDIYRQAARKFEIPELALWVLYALREQPGCTQKDLVDLLLQPKQSIHTALRSLVRDGYVRLEYSEENRKSKHIHLTEAGRKLSESTADKIVRAETIAFLSLSDTERETMLRLLERLTSAIQKEMQAVE